MKKYENLFSPIQVGNLVLRNRIALAPMSFTVQNFDRGYPQEAIQMIERIAQGGCGLITMGETVVGAGGKSHVDMVMLDEPGIERSLYRMSEACHRHGAAISIEISHGGAFAHKEFNNNAAPMAPSKYSEAPGFSRGDGTKVRPMTVNDMHHVAGQFAAAVKKVKEYGFDMAQIHMGHGWLLHQFLSPLFNNRTDEYGGSIENRMRFPLMVLERIREEVGWEFPLDVRISGTEVLDGFLDGGLDTAEVIQVCKAISKYVNMISVSCGGIHNFYTVQRMSPPVYMKRGMNVYLAAAVRSALREDGIDIPVSTVGALSEPDMMDEIISSGKADICNMARALIAEPDLPKKAKEGREDEILHCLRCSMCQHQISRAGERLARCTINPTVGFENDRTNHADIPALKSKKLVIVGGGPCGMEAALTAAKRGHKVTIIEKKDHLGGLLDFADYIPFKEDVKIYRDRQILQIRKNPSIEVLFNTVATPQMIREMKPDACFAAIGAKHKKINVKGSDSAKVIYADEIHRHEDEIGAHVVVVGGGLTGAETAIYLADKGKQVTIVGRRDRFAADTSQAHCAATNYQLSIKTKEYSNTEVTEITDEGVLCRKKGEEDTFSLKADTVIIAIGMEPCTLEAAAFETDISEFRFIGDCRKAGTIQNATMNGYYAAMDL
jgi:2,4-dienoyl-CoA reductase-like NADH-dependent reductase (Old Yellow Enzyme family)/thioredoxin reductase